MDCQVTIAVHWYHVERLISARLHFKVHGRRSRTRLKAYRMWTTNISKKCKMCSCAHPKMAQSLSYRCTIWTCAPALPPRTSSTDCRLYLIPASRAPLRRVFLDSKNVLLAYANGKARVWNYLTGEFRRSTGLEAGEDMLASGEWVEV